jgi:hypothetical protein
MTQHNETIITGLDDSQSGRYKDEYKVDRDDAGLQMANMEAAVAVGPR